LFHSPLVPTPTSLQPVPSKSVFPVIKRDVIGPFLYNSLPFAGGPPLLPRFFVNPEWGTPQLQRPAPGLRFDTTSLSPPQIAERYLSPFPITPGSDYHYHIQGHIQPLLAEVLNKTRLTHLARSFFPISPTFFFPKPLRPKFFVKGLPPHFLICEFWTPIFTFFPPVFLFGPPQDTRPFRGGMFECT